MKLSVSYFIWNFSKDFPVKSVLRKLTKMLCWQSIMALCSSHLMVTFCPVLMIQFLPQLHFPSNTTDKTWLVLSFKSNSDLVSCFPNYKKVFFFVKPSIFKKTSMHNVHLIGKEAF